MKRKPALLLCVLFLFLLLLTSCGKSTTEGAYSAVDARGKTVSLSHEPRRILTDSLHLDETLLTVVPKAILQGPIILTASPVFPLLPRKQKRSQRCGSIRRNALLPYSLMSLSCQTGQTLCL